MPIEIITDKTRRLVTTTFRGRVTAREVVEANRVYRQDPDMNEAFGFVWDLSEMETIELSQETVAALLVARNEAAGEK